MLNPALVGRDRGHQGHLCNSLLLLLISLSVFTDGVVWSCCGDGSVHRLLQGCTSKLLAHSCIVSVPSSDDLVVCDDVSAADGDVAVSVTASTISAATSCWSRTDSAGDLLFTVFWASAIDAGVVASGDLAVCGVVSTVAGDGRSGSGCSASAEGGVTTGDSVSIGGS